MKAIKENWKLVLIVAAGIIAVIFMCIFGVQGAQNKAIPSRMVAEMVKHLL